MKEKIEKLFNEYNKSEDKLFKELGKLKNCGTECNCDDPENFNYIHEGNFDEIVMVCLNCGGDVV